MSLSKSSKSSPPAADTLISWVAGEDKIIQGSREVRISFTVLGPDVHVQFLSGYEELRGKPRKATKKTPYVAVEICKTFSARRVHGRLHVLPSSSSNSLPSKSFETAPCVPIWFDISDVVLSEEQGIEERIREGVRQKLKEAMESLIECVLEKGSMEANKNDMETDDDEDSSSSSRSVTVTRTESLVQEMVILAVTNHDDPKKQDTDVRTAKTQVDSTASVQDLLASDIMHDVKREGTVEKKDKGEKKNKTKEEEESKKDAEEKKDNVKEKDDEEPWKKESKKGDEPSKGEQRVLKLLKIGAIGYAEAGKLLENMTGED